jgi:hypothetical protein
LTGDSITGKRCPFCKTDYTIYSKIEPTKENVLSEHDAKNETSIPESNITVKNEKIETDKSDRDFPNNDDKPGKIKLVFLAAAVIVVAIIAGIFIYNGKTKNREPIPAVNNQTEDNQANDIPESAPKHEDEPEPKSEDEPEIETVPEIDIEAELVPVDEPKPVSSSNDDLRAQALAYLDALGCPPMPDVENRINLWMTGIEKVDDGYKISWNNGISGDNPFMNSRNDVLLFSSMRLFDPEDINNNYASIKRKPRCLVVATKSSLRGRNVPRNENF